MITIPDYIFRDGSIKFKCPALEMSHDDALRMHNVLTDTRWPGVLEEKEYICHAMKELGFNSTLIAVALYTNYKCVALDICLWVETRSSQPARTKFTKIANIARKAWCDHMRTYLSTALSQG